MLHLPCSPSVPAVGGVGVNGYKMLCCRQCFWAKLAPEAFMCAYCELTGDTRKLFVPRPSWLVVNLQIVKRGVVGKSKVESENVEQFSVVC